MSFRIIAAMERNLGIGYKGDIPWNISCDMRYFTKVTKGNGKNAVVMGRNTWQSLACRPLKQRDNIIMSRNPDKVKNSHLASALATDISGVLQICQNNSYDDIWIIGGAEIYREFLTKVPCASCHITHIEKDYVSDTYFPMDLCNSKYTTVSIIDLNESPSQPENVSESKTDVKVHIMIPKLDDIQLPLSPVQDRHSLLYNETHQIN